MNMKKPILIILSLALLVTAAIGCSKQGPESESTKDTLGTSGENPFETQNPAQGSASNSIGHGLERKNLKTDADGKRLPLQYEGGEIKINYVVNASGKGKNVGFLVFVDGKAQPYKINNSDAPYEYMHIFNLEEEDKDTPFTFIFTPVTGKKGEKLNVTVTSVYYPAFMPDMKKTTSYGGYHTTLDFYFQIFFKADASPLKGSVFPRYDCLRNIRQSTKPVTKDTLERLNSSCMGGVTMETLNSSVFARQSFDGVEIREPNLQIKKRGFLHVTFQIVGHPGVRFKNTFYLNHQALTDGQNVSFETFLTKGNVSLIDVDIDLGKLKDFNTFYVVSVPCNPDDFPNDVIVVNKTDSVLFYK